MPFNGSNGTYTLSDTIAPATLADANELQAILDDIATALTATFCKDGQSTLSAQVKGFDGTVSAPGYSFSGDSDSGLYRIGANNLGIAVGGAKVVDYATTGITITGTLASSGNVAINTSKFTVAAASGNTLVAGTLGITSDLAVNTSKFNVTASSGNTTIAGTLGITSDLAVNTSKFTVTASSGNTLVAGTLSVTGKASLTSTDSMALPNGTTGQRNGSPTEGDYRYNSSLHTPEWYNATEWRQPGPAALGKCTLAVANVAGTISSANTGTEVITHSGVHGLTTGQLVWARSGTPPTGMTLGAVYYVNALSTTTYALYTTLANAVNDTSRVDITVSNAGAAITAATITVSANAGLLAISSTQNPFAFTCAQTGIAGTITVATAMTSAAWMPVLNWYGTDAGGSAVPGVFSITAQTSTVLTIALSDNAGTTVRVWRDLTSGQSYYIAFRGYNG